MNNLQAWLTLHLTPNLGAVGCRRLAELFGGPAEVFKAKPTELLKVKGIKPAALKVLANNPPFADAERELSHAEKLGVKIICLTDKEYPSLLRSIYSPPTILYLRGNYDCLSNASIAVVGSRAATSYGMKIARQLSTELARHNITVVSGMAMGVDTAAHFGTLDGGGCTIAALGCGIDVIYPRQNLKLYKEIMEKGLLVSEYPLGTKPDGFRFPARNRIISGMSLGVLVVEAAKKSGSLITAKMALDEGREVFATPGRVDSFKSTGTHHLLKEGAKLVHSVTDILEELPFYASQEAVDSGSPIPQTAPQQQLSSEESRLLDLLDVYPVSLDNLIMQANLPAAKINEVMLLLEIKGIIEVHPGQQFSLKNE